MLGELYSKPAAASHVLLKCCKCPVRRVPRPLASLQHTKRNRLHFPYKEIQRIEGEAWWFFISQLLECAALHLVYQGGKLQRMHE